MLPEVRRFNRQVLRDSLGQIQWSLRGKVCDVIGTVIEAYLPGSHLGTLVEIMVDHKNTVLAEVVGFRDDRVLMLPFSSMNGIGPGCTVAKQRSLTQVPVHDSMLGRVFDPFMNCLSEPGFSMPDRVEHVPADRPAPNPMERNRIRVPMSMGVRAIDTMLTMGDGQRIGIMAGSGVGKSVLLGMIARDSSADINVIALIGERGREVREFLERDLGPEGLRRSVVIAVTSDRSPLMKVRGAKVATAIAEYFSHQGKSVLLMMDSLTRVAMAQREIGLAIGEPPTTKGYTPSVFSLLPSLLERTGPQGPGCGNISGLYTVLVDGDDFNEPIADAARSILDGHIVLSRSLAARGHYPAIDVTASASRVMTDVVGKEHLALALRAKSYLASYQENLDLMQIGAYQPGSNPRLDEAIRLMPQLERFLCQAADDHSNLEQSLEALRRIVATAGDFERNHLANR